MIYLASPYTHQHDHIMQARYIQAVHATAHLVGQGLNVYSPIVHFHMVAMMHKLPKDFYFWERLALAMIDRCDTFAVLQIEGWEQSLGVAKELDYAIAQGKQVTYYDESISCPA